MSDGKFIETFSNWLNDTNKEEYLLVKYFIFLLFIIRTTFIIGRICIFSSQYYCTSVRKSIKYNVEHLFKLFVFV